jgi:hypothetical protein
MRYPVDYVRHAAREIRKIETRTRVGNGEEQLSPEQLADLLKTLWKALDEMADAIEGLQRSRE